MFVNMDNCQEKMEQQDNASTRVPEEVDLELMHRNFFDSAEERRTEYYALYRQLISELRSSHLEGFANVLMKQQKHVVKNQHELICEMKEQLMRSLQNSLDRFWEEYDVSNRIAELEMLKEQYKQFQGNSWNILKMNPIQRTLPLRMRFKEVRIRHLEKQLDYQNELLKNFMELNDKERSRIQCIEKMRKSMSMSLVRYSKDVEQKKTLAKNMANNLLDNMEKDFASS